MRLLPHVHYYDVVFPSDAHPFKHRLRCRCGDEAPDAETAYHRMQLSHLRRFGVVVIYGFAIVVAFACTLFYPRGGTP